MYIMYKLTMGECGSISLMNQPPFHLVILGATGLVGQQVLDLALSDHRIGRITAPTRRPVAERPKLSNPRVDYRNLAGTDWWHADAVICALGTTLKAAGGKAGLREVDFRFVLDAAWLAKRAGVARFVLNSSLGADPDSANFYLKTKGETEQALAAMGFSALTLVRPSLLDGGPRPERRPGEQAGLWLGKRLGSLIPARYRPVSTRAVAKAMLESALNSQAGMQILENDQLLSDYSIGNA